MSIVTLNRVTFIGHIDDKRSTIEELQRLGCLHLIPLTETGERGQSAASGVSREALEALRFLASGSYQRRQVTDAQRLDALSVQTQALALMKHLYKLRQDRDFIAQRLEDLAPWGDFAFAPLEQMGGYRLWFYVVPKRELASLARIEAPWEVVAGDHRFAYVTVVAAAEPQDVPFERTLSGALGPGALARQLEEIELEIEDVEAERAALTQWCTLFARSLDGLIDHSARQTAEHQTYDEAPLFALQGWAPRNRLAELAGFSNARRLVMEATEPMPDDEPPTLFENPPPLQAGEDLVSFYRTPAYRLWDPSSTVFFSFAIFFAMIIADAGYGLLLTGITGWLWKRLSATPSKRSWRTLLATLSATTMVYGVIVGSYFGVSPDAGTLLAGLRLIDVADSAVMMPLTIAIGGIHIMLANLREARATRSLAALAPLGWALTVAGGLALGATIMDATFPRLPGQIALILGALLVLVFTGYGAQPGARAAMGLLALTNLTKLFGDVLSYLRLFALGLASASLAIAFNSMAADVHTAFPGTGLLFAILILILGHGLNFVLGMAGAVIHGLRLNLLEFFDWGVKYEGSPFRTFRRKESD